MSEPYMLAFVMHWNVTWDQLADEGLVDAAGGMEWREALARALKMGDHRTDPGVIQQHVYQGQKEALRQLAAMLAGQEGPDESGGERLG